VKSHSAAALVILLAVNVAACGTGSPTTPPNPSQATIDATPNDSAPPIPTPPSSPLGAPDFTPLPLPSLPPFTPPPTPPGPPPSVPFLPPPS
jgi:hypothetical protein